MRHPCPPHRVLAVVSWLLLLAALAGYAMPPRAAPGEAADLPEEHRLWLEAVTLLLTDEEREVFLSLRRNYQRDAFIRRFWRGRDPDTRTGRNELKEVWEERVEEARLLFGTLGDDRGRFLLLAGVPQIRCAGRHADVEMWFYEGHPKAPIGVEVLRLIFFRPYGLGEFRIWYPGDRGLEMPSSPVAAFETCNYHAAMASLARNRRRLGEHELLILLERLQQPPPPPSGEWVATFAAYTTDLPEGAETFSAELGFDFPGRVDSRTAVQALLAVPVGEVARAGPAAGGSFNFLITGEVLRGDELFESFRYKFDVPAGEVAGGSIPLVVERYLRPGSYTLILKTEDLTSGRFFRTEQGLEIPAVDEVLPAPGPSDPELARLLAEANELLRRGEASLKILPPRGEFHTHLVRFHTLTGGPVARVSFLLDGQPILSKGQPPFTVELDLGPYPRPHTLTAVAYDGGGDEVARDEIGLNAGQGRFGVRLLEPQRGKSYGASLRARAEVEVPEGEEVERVEVYLNETLLATLYQPPWVQPIVLADGSSLAYVRAVAYLADGNAAEDLVFINAPGYLEEMAVEFVELYAAVLDRKGRPVEDLSREDFTVLEDGVRQEIRRFERSQALPLHVGVLLDVSASMAESLGQAREAARRFFEQALTPKDRAAVITFNDYPHLAVPLTNDPGRLAGGLAGLKAERGTALYDALLFALYTFNGVTGQRAILVLSDGKDEHSRFRFEEALEFARRTGITLYAIGLGDAARDGKARRKLKKLAEDTGGRSFFLVSAEELPAIYDTIQRELRSRYLVAYQSSNLGRDGAFRSIEVKLARGGLEVQAPRGYYP